MKRTPIACCLEEGGEWVRWQHRYAGKVPIRIYRNGLVEDDITGEKRAYDEATMRRLKSAIRADHL